MKDHKENKKNRPERSEEKGLSRREIFVSGVTSAALVTLGSLDPKTAVAQDLGEEGLVLRMPGLRYEVQEFFEQLGRDSRERERFVRNPTQVMLSRFFPGQEVPPQELSDANRFLFSALANDEFRIWMEVYQERLRADLESGRTSAERPPNKERVLRDTAAALAEYGDEDLLFSLLKVPDSKLSVVVVEVAIAWFIVALGHIVVTAIDFTPIMDDGPLVLDSVDLRGLSEQLLQHAQEAAGKM